MKKAIFTLACILTVLVSCQPRVDTDPSTAGTGGSAPYFISFKADKQEYRFDQTNPSPPKIFNMNASGVSGSLSYSPGSVNIDAYGKSPTWFSLKTIRAASGSPESIPIGGGNFTKDQFTAYTGYLTLTRSTVGTLVITNINNEGAEGTFTMDVYATPTSDKLSLTDGKFKVRF